MSLAVTKQFCVVGNYEDAEGKKWEVINGSTVRFLIFFVESHRILGHFQISISS